MYYSPNEYGKKKIPKTAFRESTQTSLEKNERTESVEVLVDNKEYHHQNHVSCDDISPVSKKVCHVKSPDRVLYSCPNEYERNKI